jgi:hypothetical protein
VFGTLDYCVHFMSRTPTISEEKVDRKSLYHFQIIILFMNDGVSAGRDDGVCGRAGSQHPRAGLQAWRSHWVLVDQMESPGLDSSKTWTSSIPGLERHFKFVSHLYWTLKFQPLLEYDIVINWTSFRCSGFGGIFGVKHDRT